ncbi:MAG: hypothetical protein ACNA8L_14065, partial [Luteolibacter sp.]
TRRINIPANPISTPNPIGPRTSMPAVALAKEGIRPSAARFPNSATAGPAAAPTSSPCRTATLRPFRSIACLSNNRYRPETSFQRSDSSPTPSEHNNARTNPPRAAFPATVLPPAPTASP